MKREFRKKNGNYFVFIWSSWGFCSTTLGSLHQGATRTLKSGTCTWNWRQLQDGLNFPIGSYSLLMKIESATFSMNGTLTASLNKGFRQAVNSSIAFKKTSSKGRKRVDYLLQSFTAWNTSCTFSMCYGIASWRALDGYLVQLLPKLIRVRTAKDWTTGRDTRLSDI